MFLHSPLLRSVRFPSLLISFSLCHVCHCVSHSVVSFSVLCDHFLTRVCVLVRVHVRVCVYLRVNLCLSLSLSLSVTPSLCLLVCTRVGPSPPTIHGLATPPARPASSFREEMRAAFPQRVAEPRSRSPPSGQELRVSPAMDPPAPSPPQSLNGHPSDSSRACLLNSRWTFPARRQAIVSRILFCFHAGTRENQVFRMIHAIFKAPLVSCDLKLSFCASCVLVDRNRPCCFLQRRKRTLIPRKPTATTADLQCPCSTRLRRCTCTAFAACNPSPRPRPHRTRGSGAPTS